MLIADWLFRRNRISKAQTWVITLSEQLVALVEHSPDPASSGTKGKKDTKVTSSDSDLGLPELSYVSYLLIGGYGNFLIGNPFDWQQFKPVFEKHGGIKAFLPLCYSPDYRVAAQGLFRRYGARTLVEDHDSTLDWSLATCLPQELSDLDFRLKLIKVSGTPCYRFTYEGQTVVVSPGLGYLSGKVEQQGPLPEALGSQAVLPTWLERGTDFPQPLPEPPLELKVADDLSDSEQQHPLDLAIKQRLGQPIDMLVDGLKQQRFISQYLPSIRAIALYDDVEFERNDYEVLSPESRTQMSELLQQLGAKQPSASNFQLKQLEVVFAKRPATLMSALTDGLETKNKPDDAQPLRILTPTQAVAVLFDSLNEQVLELRASSADNGTGKAKPLSLSDAAWMKDRMRDVLKVYGHLPVNQKKIKPALSSWEHLDLSSLAEEAGLEQASQWSLASLQKLQNEVVSFYRKRRPRGSKGPCFEPVDIRPISE